MALTSIGPLMVPAYPNGLANTTLQARLLDTNGEKLAYVIQVPKAGTLHSFEFPTLVVTTFPTDGIKLSFQDVDTASASGTAEADEVVDQFFNITSNPGSNAWVVPGGALTSDGGGGDKRIVSRGEFLACVIEQVTPTDTWAFNVGLLDAQYGYPSAQAKSGGAWASTNDMPCMALKYDDGSYAFIASWLYPIKTTNNPSFGSASDPKERGLYFQFPVQVKVSGAWFFGNPSGNCDLVLYDSNGTTELASVSIDADYRSGSGTRQYTIVFPSEITLSATTNYRLVLQPTTSTTVNLVDFDVESATLLDSVEGGQNFHYTQKSSGDVWSQTTTKRPFMGLIVSSVHDGSGGGGGGTIVNIME